jgi:subtilisin family serine protease
MSSMRFLPASFVLCVWAALTAMPAWAQNAPARRVIPNQYVVVMAPQQAAAVVNVAAALAETHNAQVTHVYRYALQGMAVQMTPASAAAMAADPRVELVVQDEEASIDARQDDGTASPLTTQPGATWGLDRVDQRDLPLNTTYVYNYTATGVHVYIIDTGLRATHTQFTGRVGNGADFINDGRGTGDCNGHGTHVAGTAAGTTHGVAKQAIVHPVRVFGCGSSSPFSTLIAGVDWVAANHVKPAVANMSFGGSGYAPLDTAVVNLINAGVIAVVAAGNDDIDACAVSPARLAAAITVGASDIADVRSTFSNWGACLDLFAPGTAIDSAGIGSDTATAIFSGTSMASPHVAGIAALYLSQHGNQSPATVATAIINNASVNKLVNVGTGSPNRLAYSLWGAASSSAIEALWPVNGAQPGGTAPLWALVRNTGTAPLPADARVWFQVNGPGVSNQWVGSASVAGLAAGAAAWYSYNWAIPGAATPGTYEYRAQVWTNTGPHSSLFGPQGFIVTASVGATIQSLWPVTGARQGGSATLWAFVRNTGSVALPAEARVWFLVAGPSFNSWVGSASVAGLAPGATAWYSYNWAIPGNQTPGNYEYRSQVWKTSSEPLSGVFGPQAFTVDATQVQANVLQLWEVVGIQKGTSAPLWAYVRNTGTVPLPADARVWFKVTGPSYDSWVGNASVAGLAPGATAWYSYNWTAPAGLTDGNYAYHAQVWTDAETISNYQGPMAFPVNAFQSQVYLLWPVSGAARNATVPLWAHVYNQSNTPLPAGARVWFYVVGPGYTAWVGSTLVQGLAARTAAWYAFNWTIPANQPAGAYNYFAQVWTGSAISSLTGPQAFSILTFAGAGAVSFAAPPDPFVKREGIDAPRPGAR